MHLDYDPVSPYGSSLTKRFVSLGAESILFRPDIIVENDDVHPHVSSLRKRRERFHEQVTLVGYMGGDDTIEFAATAGHGRGIFSERPSSNQLLEHLVALGIDQPFRFAQLRFAVQGPISYALKNTVYWQGASVNEMSGRYSVLPQTAYIPTVEEIEARLDVGMSGNAQQIHDILVKVRDQSDEDYMGLSGLEVARELARVGLGSDTHTGFLWKVDLLTLSHYVKQQRRFLASDDHGLKFVESIASMAGKTAPSAWQALMKDCPQKMNLTRPSDDVIVGSDFKGAPWEPQETKRPVVSELEERLFSNVSLLLGDGAFQFTDYMGDNLTVVDAARVSYQGGTERSRGAKGLIRYLVEHRHTTPLEMPELAFMARMPLFVVRQNWRHRTADQTGFMGEFPLGNSNYIPSEENLMYQSGAIKQGREGALTDEDKEEAYRLFSSSFDEQRNAATELRALGTPEDMVRRMRGVGGFTRFSMTTDAKNGLHYLGLRDDDHAQYEIRVLAAEFREGLKAQVPDVYQAAQDFYWSGMRFTEAEVRQIANMVDFSGLHLGQIRNFEDVPGFLARDPVTKRRVLGRRGRALREKLKKLKLLSRELRDGEHGL
jgi:thymidylate synthase (FAD)